MGNEKRRVLSVRVRASTLLGAFDLCDVCGVEAENMSTALVQSLERILLEKRSTGQLPSYDEQDADLLLSDRVIEVGKLSKERTLRGQVKIRTHNQISTEKQASLAGLMSVGGSEFSPLTSERLASAGNVWPDKFAPPDTSCMSTEEFKREFEGDWDVVAAREQAELSFQNQTESEPQTTREEALGLMSSLASLFEGALEEQREADEQDLLASLSIGGDPLSKTPSARELSQSNEISPNDLRLENDKLYKSLKDEVQKRTLRTIYNNISRDLWSTQKAVDLLEQMLRSV